jgi:hypothetical protein
MAIQLPVHVACVQSTILHHHVLTPASAIHDFRHHELHLVNVRTSNDEANLTQASRITYINDQGVCIIGMQKIAMMPLIVFEVIVNVSCSCIPILTPF